MRKSIRRSIVATAVVAAGVGLTAPPALASHTWTLAGVPATGTATGTSSNTTLTIQRSGAVLRCTTATATVKDLVNGSQDGNEVGHLYQPDGTTWTNCSGPLNIRFTVSHIGTWNLNLFQETSNANVNVGNITNVHATVQGSTCNATFKGGAPGRYTNGSPPTLTLDPTAPTPSGFVPLTASGVSGCFGLIQNGDVARFAGTYSINQPISVTHD